MKRFLILVLVTLLVLSCTNAVAEWLYATKGDTKIHVSPSIDSDTYGIFYKGEKVWVEDHTYTPDGRNWCHVNYYGKTGYISDRYSSYDVSNPNDYEEIGGTGYDETEYYDDDYCDDDAYDEFEYEEEFEFVVTNKTKARALPDRNSDSLGKLAYGTLVYGSRVYTAQDGKAWLEIQGDTGKTGYVSTDNLRLTKGLVENHFPTLARYMAVTGGRVNVREDADIDSKDVGTIHKGDVLIVDFYVCVDDNERRMWAHAYDEYGNYIGFVSTLYLTASQG